MSTPIVRRRKRPVEVDTIQWTGSNLDDLIGFTGGDFLLVDAIEGTFAPDITAKVYDNLHDTWVGVKTGQHVVRGVSGEFYPIAEGVLAETYEPCDGALGEGELLPKVDVVAWLVKKAREGTPIEQLASKVARGAIRPDNLRMLPATFFEADRRYVSGTCQFRCEAITPSPGTGEIRALGWKRAPLHGVHLWHAAALDPDDWVHGDWADVTETGASRG